VAETLFYHDILRAFAKARVRFVIVGGVAVNLRGVPRFTADLDVCVALDAENLTAIERALRPLGLVPRPGPVIRLADEATGETGSRTGISRHSRSSIPTIPCCRSTS
jgi:hypothetical protein